MTGKNLNLLTLRSVRKGERKRRSCQVPSVRITSEDNGFMALPLLQTTVETCRVILILIQGVLFFFKEEKNLL